MVCGSALSFCFGEKKDLRCIRAIHYYYYQNSSPAQIYDTVPCRCPSELRLIHRCFKLHEPTVRRVDNDGSEILHSRGRTGNDAAMRSNPALGISHLLACCTGLQKTPTVLYQKSGMKKKKKIYKRFKNSRMRPEHNLFRLYVCYCGCFFLVLFAGGCPPPPFLSPMPPPPPTHTHTPSLSDRGGPFSPLYLFPSVSPLFIIISSSCSSSCCCSSSSSSIHQ